jgi:hypothetical protein
MDQSIFLVYILSPDGTFVHLLPNKDIEAPLVTCSRFA